MTWTTTKAEVINELEELGNLLVLVQEKKLSVSYAAEQIGKIKNMVRHIGGNNVPGRSRTRDNAS